MLCMEPGRQSTCCKRLGRRGKSLGGRCARGLAVRGHPGGTHSSSGLCGVEPGRPYACHHHPWRSSQTLGARCRRSMELCGHPEGPHRAGTRAGVGSGRQPTGHRVHRRHGESMAPAWQSSASAAQAQARYPVSRPAARSHCGRRPQCSASLCANLEHCRCRVRRPRSADHARATAAAVWERRQRGSSRWAAALPGGLQLRRVPAGNGALRAGGGWRPARAALRGGHRRRECRQELHAGAGHDAAGVPQGGGLLHEDAHPREADALQGRPAHMPRLLRRGRTPASACRGGRRLRPPRGSAALRGPGGGRAGDDGPGASTFRGGGGQGGRGGAA
mmetsp:Transcript_33838/g.87779  ORF Transcript_33838/g.87779 Transcript_33838/m.87779 type:complete len:333 (-) Transcript_33838:616-1614(-)